MQSPKAMDQVIQRLAELKDMLSGDKNSLKSDMRKGLTSLESRLTNIEAGADRLFNMTMATAAILIFELVCFWTSIGTTFFLISKNILHIIF